MSPNLANNSGGPLTNPSPNLLHIGQPVTAGHGRMGLLISPSGRFGNDSFVDLLDSLFELFESILNRENAIVIKVFVNTVCKLHPIFRIFCQSFMKPMGVKISLIPCTAIVSEQGVYHIIFIGTEGMLGIVLHELESIRFFPVEPTIKVIGAWPGKL